MDSMFDIFKRLPDGAPVWIVAVRGRTEAEKQMALEAANSPGEYFVYSQEEGLVAKVCSDASRIRSSK